ncbi:DUF58 domain-containing protein [uncultured Actinomyces sp.]|uniref:DUF58 domain-containing protein n=1 Tax=uncultured Actinomyces sp. TaxID=249061 RepID=UPI00288A343F|nr:DUF58 domain-containing protein [uncultured Actinomyces sp.]
MTISSRVAALVAIGIIPIVLSPTPGTLATWLLFVIVLTLVDAVLAPSPRKLQITRQAPKSVRANERSVSVIHVKGANRTMRGVLRDAWQPSAGATANRHKFKLSPGESEDFSTALLPTRRGILKADAVTVRSWGPLGLAAIQTTFDLPGTIRVLPEFPSKQLLPGALAKLQQMTGQILARARGQGTEFDSLREWVDGDDQRSIDWRATARSKDVIVRTWRPERDRHIVMVIDTSRMSAQRLGDQTRLDANLDAALLLSAVTARAGDSISMIAADAAIRTQVIRPSRTTVLGELSSAMAPLDPALVEVDWAQIAGKLTAFGNKMSLVVLFTALDVTVLEESLLPALLNLAKHTRVVIANASDPQLHKAEEDVDIKDPYFVAATEFSRAEREKAAQALASAGITVVEAPPSKLSMAVVDHYLNLKSRGLL